MIKKQYKEIILNNGKKDLTILFENLRNSELLTSFLYSDVIPFEDWIKSDIDNVLSGEIDRKEISGNVCNVEITLKKTKIYDSFIDDDEEYYGTFCEIDTTELKDLINEWCNKVREYRKS